MLRTTWDGLPVSEERPFGAAVADVEVEISSEHDRFERLSLGEACARCRPAVVASGLDCAAAATVSS